MATMFISSEIAPENLRLMLLAYGLDNAYRVVTFREIARSLPHARRDEIRSELARLADEGLLMKFAGRYCFNKAIPVEIRHRIEQMITASGTIRLVR
jgi:hypothetical protein